MIGKYGRKKMLAAVAEQFTEAQVDWLNQNAEFRALCAEAETQEPIMKLASRLLEQMPKPPRPSQRPPIPPRLQGPNAVPVTPPSAFVNALNIPPIPDLPPVAA